MKKLLTSVVGIVMLGGVAVAEEKTNKIETFGKKVSNHITMEIEKTKEFQKKNWAEAKVQWSNLIKKFSTK
tara:strand:+ start:326 stop:538 length:213 start_codon:yes stop_codon:yes gene_type:complete